MKHFQPSVQRVMLTQLADIYPNTVPQSKLQGDFPEEVFDFNLFYLWDHGMIFWHDADIGDDRAQRRVRITAKGVDHLRRASPLSD